MRPFFYALCATMFLAFPLLFAACDGEEGDDITEVPSCSGELDLSVGPFVLPLTAGTYLVRWQANNDTPSGTCLQVSRGGVAIEGLLTVSRPQILENEECFLCGNRDEPETKYIYEATVDIMPGGEFGWSLSHAGGTKTGSFRLPTTEFAHLALIGDTDTMPLDDSLEEEYTKLLLKQIRVAAPDLLVHAGDLVYHSYGDDWEHFFNIFQESFEQMPVLPAIGNHEYLEFPNEIEEYTLPLLGRSDGGRVLVADVGPVRLITIDSNFGEKLFTQEAQDEMWQEVEIALASAGTQVKALVFHHPIYSLSKHSPDRDLRQKVISLDEEYDINLVLTGHNHVYERFLIPERFHTLVSGGGGALLYDIKDSGNEDPESLKYLVKDAREYHWADLKISATAIDVAVYNQRSDLIETTSLDIR